MWNSGKENRSSRPHIASGMFCPTRTSQKLCQGLVPRLSEHHCQATAWLSGGHWLGKERVSSSHAKVGLQPPLAHVYEAEPWILCCSCMAEGSPHF